MSGYKVIFGAAVAVILGGIFALAAGTSGGAVGAALPTLGATPTATATNTPICGVQWSIVSSPNEGDGFNSLSSVSAVSPSDVWAVGSYTTTVSDIRQPLIQHWNGSAWSIVPSPGPGALFSVEALDDNDVWAVGYIGADPGPFQTLIQHWNGIAWSVVPSPNPGSNGGKLLDLSALDTDDIWAVGFNVEGIQLQTLTLHWDGAAWTQIASPNAAFNTELSGVTAIDTDDVWAVGAYLNPQRRYVPTTMHWDGAAWTVNTPNASLQGYLYTTANVSSNDVWAVGYWFNVTMFQTLTMHWDGAAWTQVSAPNPGLSYNFLYNVSAISSDEVWAVGQGGGTLAIRWDGAAWTQVPSPNANGGGNFAGLEALSSADVWTVGDYYVPNDGQFGSYLTLIEHYADPCAGYTSTPTITATSTPTDTPIDTATPTNTQTNSPTSTPSRTVTRTSTATLTPNPTNTVTFTPTRTPTITPTLAPVLVGHVNWQARPPQPDGLQALPITITLKSNATEVNYPTQFTDQYGFFTVTLNGLPNDTYSWRADDATSALHSPNYLANSGTIVLSTQHSALSTQVDMGLMMTGDANDDNQVSLFDFIILKVAFGNGCGNAGYDNRADFTGDCLVNVTDFIPMKANFGLPGAPPIGPRWR